MISTLRGTVTGLGAAEAVVETAGGVGFVVFCTPATAAALRLGEEARLETYLVVREDSLTLFGFRTAAERACFVLLQSASGIGPKLALAVLTVLTPAQVRDALLKENEMALIKVPGIGRKVAARLVLELHDKALTLPIDEPVAETSRDDSWRAQVTEGLQGLGYSLRDAEAACATVAPLIADDPGIGIGALMRAALQSLAR